MAHRIGIDARTLSDESAVGSYLRNLTAALGQADRDNDYFLFVRSPSEPAVERLPANFHPVLETCPVYSIREQASLSWRLLRLKLDLYHATHYLLPAVVPCRSVITVHDVLDVFYPHFVPSPLAFFYAQRQIRRSLARGDRIIADSRNTKTDLMDYLGIDGRRVRVIYPGVSEVLRRRVPAPEIDRRLGRLQIARPYLLLVEDGAGPSNLDRAVKAFAQALETGPFDGSLVCSGPRTGLDFKLRQRAETLGIADRLRLIGPLSEDERPAVFQAAELFLYPTLQDGGGPTVADAMAAETPVVAASNASLREIAEGYAVLVDPLSRAAIANAIADCMGDPDHRRQLAVLGSRRAADFDWSQAAAKTLEAYESALRQKAWRPRGRRRGKGE